ncbi:hypothetical protein A33Q_0344 [Indibacter alkaliphilus LW1]|jgi:hypothetical protein|uniref:Uncharacterized protein n=1 Tax=Indibacter alkaliphilus (strain CCUG 57479 / KCTC 22604 / LW1) TaxID=1189612 RepID=S2EBD1_INDAL|nr:hypothetical protein [Indibacter alkaliphilus]EOZ99663.1 hypothetical protein A33Q_0344 [Indibacter alkaliphilus LW1]
MKLGKAVDFGSPTALFEFDEKSQKWRKLRDLDFSNTVTSNEVFMIGDTVFAIYHDGLRSINLNNFQSILHDFVNGYTLNREFHPLQSVGIGGRMYIYNGDYSISEFDPEFF